MNVSLRTVGIAGLVAALSVAGAYVYGRSRVPVKTETVEVAGAKREEGRATVNSVVERGPVKVTRTKTKPTPSGPVTTVTVVEKAPVKETTTSSLSAQKTETVSSKSESRPVGDRWWRVYGEADWRLNAISPTPTNVEIGADARVLGPLRLGVKAEGNPERLRDTGSVSATVRVEF